MNQFPALIEYLLLNHNYVVIPGLGTFIAQPTEAQRNEQEEAFLPPVRLVRFNADLIHDDNLVATSIAAIYKTDVEQACKLLTTWVDEFHQTLEDNGCLEFGAIGVFGRENNGDITFTSQESGVMTPEYYGLDSFHFSEVKQEKRAKTVPLVASAETSEKEITIRLNRRVVNGLVAACAAILLFIVFLNPMPESHREVKSSLRELFVPVEMDANPVVDANPDLASVEAVDHASGQISATPLSPKPIDTATQSSNATGEYCIVLASAISQENAERYVKTLTDRGFLSARVVVTGNMTRVVVGHFQNEDEANASAREIRSRSSEYQGAWVHHL